MPDPLRRSTPACSGGYRAGSARAGSARRTSVAVSVVLALTTLSAAACSDGGADPSIGEGVGHRAAPAIDPTGTTPGPTSTTRPPEPPTTPPPTPPPTPPKSAVPATFPPVADPPRTVDAATPLSVLAFGDSTAFTIGWGVSAAATASGLARVTVDARTSTGLTRSDYFDWQLQVLAIASAPPEVAVISFGANDAQPIVRPDGASVAFGTPGWAEEYGRRADGVLSVLEAAGTRVYWVGQPIARDPGYSDRMRIINEAVQSAIARHPGATFVDAWHWLSDDAGGYTDALPGADGAPVVMRADDGIHLSREGGDYLGGTVLNRVLADHGVAM